MPFHVGQLVRQRSNYDFGIARIANLHGSIAELLRPSGERQNRSITELEFAVLSPSMLCRVAEHKDPLRIVAVVAPLQPGLRTVHLEEEATGAALRVTEDAILELLPATDPVSRLLSLDHRGRHTLLSREALLHGYAEVQSNCRGLEDLAGARIELMPHQVTVAERALSLPAPRVILADEAGLGKTVECGMILSVLSRYQPALRVLVLCPGALSRKWLGEMYSRFSAQVFALAELYQPANLAGMSRLIASYAALAQSDKLREALLAQPWDVIVVDKAHRLPASSAIYDFVRALSQRTPGLILLAATANRARSAEYAQLFSLLDTQDLASADAAQLAKTENTARAISALLKKTAEAGAPSLPQLTKPWLELLAEDALVRELAEKLGGKGRSASKARDKLLRHVAAWYGDDNRVLRHRRAALTDELPSPKRALSRSNYAANEAEKRVTALMIEWGLLLSADAKSPSRLGQFIAAQGLQLAASSSGAVSWLVTTRREGLKSQEAPSPSLLAALELPSSQLETRQLLRSACRQIPLRAGEKALLTNLEEALAQWAQDEPRLQAVASWALSQLEEKPRDKILLFVEQPETLQALQQKLSQDLSRKRLRAAGLHAAMSPEERERAAQHFLNVDSTAVLLCDQLGGEGRSFAAASWVGHVDAPWDVEAIEQRIGRLDRGGRKEDVRIVAVHSDFAVEQRYAELLWGKLELGQRPLAGLELLAAQLVREFWPLALPGKDAPLATWLSQTTARIAKERQLQVEDHHAIFDDKRWNLEDAEELIEELVADSQIDFKLLSDWARKADILIKPSREPDIYEVDIGGQTRPLVTLQAEKLRCTTDRERAVDNPALQFLTWGHPIARALLSDAEHYLAARCTHVSHSDDEGRSWRGCRVRVLLQAHPQHLAALPAALRGRVGYVARPMEETLFVRFDGQVETDEKTREWLEKAFAKSHNADYLSLAADEPLYMRFAKEVESAAAAALSHVQTAVVPVFVAPSEELASDEEFAACRARQAVSAERFAAAPRRLAQQLVTLYERALKSIAEPLLQIDNLSFLNVVPRAPSTTSARSLGT